VEFVGDSGCLRTKYGFNGVTIFGTGANGWNGEYHRHKSEWFAFQCISDSHSGWSGNIQYHSNVVDGGTDHFIYAERNQSECDSRICVPVGAEWGFFYCSEFYDADATPGAVFSGDSGQRAEAGLDRTEYSWRWCDSIQSSSVECAAGGVGLCGWSSEFIGELGFLFE
jgi:hypothetical protein